MKIKNKYTASSIKLLSGLDGIKKRPEMYIGDVNSTGLYQLIYEVIDNSIDETIIGKCTKIIVKINKNKSISVKDNGRGIPIGVKLNDTNEIKRSAIEIICTELHSGGKFDNNNYETSGGLHGLGISCVNALSKWLKIIVYRNKKIYYIKFNNSKIQNKIIEEHNGVYISPPKLLGETKERGTEIIFLPDKKFFKNFNYNENILIKRLQELSYLNKRIQIIFINKNLRKIEKFFSKKGIKDFIKNLNKKNPTINKKTLYIKKKFCKSTVEIAITWNNTLEEKILCYTNNIYQKDGGTHLTGVKLGITKTINKYINEIKNSKKNLNITGDDIRKGLICITSIKIPNPKFNSQTKDKLLTEEAKSLTENCVTELIKKFLNKKTEIKKLYNKIIKTAEIRTEKSYFRSMNKKINSKNKSNIIISKFSDCQEINPDKSEIFIVEGDSAGGSAKQCRNRKFQAILPLKGKILNVEKAKYDKLINSEQIIILIRSLGCGIGDNFNIKNIKYKKIIIMTDADADGSHIRSLLLTFLHKYMPILIEQGYIYIAQPPLYRIKYKKRELYFKNNEKLNSFIEKLSIKNINSIKYIQSNKILPEKKIKKYIKIYINTKKFLKIKKIKSEITDYILDNNLKIDIKDTLSSIISAFNIRNIKLKKYKKFNIKIIFKKNFNKLMIKINILKFKFIKKNFLINKKFLLKIKYDNLCKIAKNIKNLIKKGLIIKKISKDIKIYSFKKLIYNMKKITKSYIKKQRYKGLGEMNPDQLWNTTMDPEKRNLIKIKAGDIEKSNKIFSTLMGGRVNERKIFLKNYYDKL